MRHPEDVAKRNAILCAKAGVQSYSGPPLLPALPGLFDVICAGPPYCSCGAKPGHAHKPKTCSCSYCNLGDCGPVCKCGFCAAIRHGEELRARLKTNAQRILDEPQTDDSRWSQLWLDEFARDVLEILYP